MWGILWVARKMKNYYTRILSRIIQWPRIIFYKIISTAVIKGDPICYQPLHACGEGEINILGQVRFGVFPSPHFFSSVAFLEVTNKNSQIIIGDGTWINNKFSVRVEHTSVTIGKRVLIGWGVEIIDSNFHGVDITCRNKSEAKWSQPVIIKDDVFLGANVSIQKGVTIGTGSVVAAGSIVIRDVPENVVVAGNPAKIVKRINKVIE